MPRTPHARKARVALAAGLAMTAVAVPTTALSAQAAPPAATDSRPWMNTKLDADRRATLLLARMTLDQKIAMLIQSGGPGVPELGIPAIRGKDGCCGLTTNETPTTSLPKGVALASTFDNALAREYGAVAGEETRATGFNAIAGPTMDLTRTPFNGRMWEALGEDPLLNGALATAQVQGQQSHQVSTLVKHYNLNNHETRRGHVDVQVDERTLQEVYTRPWEKLVTEADPGAIMCSFNLVNGEQGCGSDILLNRILKEQLGFQGYVSSDFNAVHSFDDYANGLDVAGPGIQFSGPNLKAAVQDGRVAQSRVDDAVRRVLRTMFALGIIDNPPVGSFTNPQPTAATIPAAVLDDNDLVAAQTAEKGIVLLKNESAALPLRDGSSVAVIGSDADHYIDGGGSGAVPRPARLTTILDGITSRAGGTVQHAPGTDPVSLADTLPGPAPVPGSVLSDVQAEYRLGKDRFTGRAMKSRTEQQVNLRTGISADAINTSQVPALGFPLALMPLSARWTTTLTAPATGEYELAVSHLGRARLFLDGRLAIDEAGTAYGTSSTTVQLTAGQEVDVVIEYVTDAPNQFDGGLNDQPGAMMRFGWTPPAEVLSPAMQEAVDLAASSDVAVVVARDYTGEAADRGSLALPQDQDRLIQAVAAANPNTVVVLATSGPVTMPWVDQVPAIVEAWYAGQSQGRSVARVLYGDVNPSGKLPVTFPATELQVEQTGVKNPFHTIGERTPTVAYSEGVMVGYRGYEANGVTPMFPFGHGLSYTTFDYANLRTQGVNTKAKNKVANVKVQVTNSGPVAGDEVVQVYVGPLPTAVETPPLQLAGYSRVSLEPGAKANVSVDLDARSLQYWDAAADAWVTPTGTVGVYVGSSVDDLRLNGTITVK